VFLSIQDLAQGSTPTAANMGASSRGCPKDNLLLDSVSPWLTFSFSPAAVQSLSGCPQQGELDIEH